LPGSRHIQDLDRSTCFSRANAEAVSRVAIITDYRDEDQTIAVDGEVPFLTRRKIE
jgi:hypothetical protein